jgi:rhodanese-related sulfurtransferase
MSRSLKGIDIAHAVRLRDSGALMVDVREAHEFAGARIPGSHHAALSNLEAANLPLVEGQAIVFYCASGGRTNLHAARLAAKASGAEAYVMTGGIVAWGRAGLPIEAGFSNRSR